MRNYYTLCMAFAIFSFLFSNKSLAQDCISFDGASGTYAVTGGFPVGTPFHTESGANVSLHRWTYMSGSLKSNVFVQAGEFFWSGLFTLANTTYIRAEDAAIEVDFTTAVTVAGEVSFDFLDWEGDINLEINDEPVNVAANFSDLSENIAPGVTLDVVDQNVGVSGKMGTVTLTGTIFKIAVGGQEFGIDDICWTAGQLPTCAIEQVFASASACTPNGVFNIEVSDFNASNHSGSFDLMVDNTNYGSYEAADFPLSVGPFNGDGTTIYNVVLVDSEDPNCTGSTSVGPVTCEVAGDCSFTNGVITPGECTSEETFSVTLNFDYENPASNQFVVMDLDGGIILTESYSNLPLTVTDVHDGDEETITVNVCDSEDQNCCTTITFETLDCQTTTECTISNVMLERTACEGGEFMVMLDLNTQNEGNLGFQVFGNGNNYGSHSYSDLPIMLGPFTGNGNDEYEFVVVDMLTQTCSNFNMVDAYNCIEECFIDNLQISQGNCTPDNQVPVTISFESDNTSANFTITESGAPMGNFSYVDGAATLMIDADGETTYELVLTDNMSAVCTNSIVIGPFNCTVSSIDDTRLEGVNIFTDRQTDVLNVQFAEVPQEARIGIFDITGKLLIDQKSQGNSQLEIDITTLSGGIYFCKVEMNGKKLVRKFGKIN